MNKTISILIFLPIIYAIIFGELFSNNVVNEIPIIFVNLDDGTQVQKKLKIFHSALSEIFFAKFFQNCQAVDAQKFLQKFLKFSPRVFVVIFFNFARFFRIFLDTTVFFL